MAFGAVVGTGTWVPARERNPSYHLRVRGAAGGKENDRAAPVNSRSRWARSYAELGGADPLTIWAAHPNFEPLDCTQDSTTVTLGIDSPTGTQTVEGDFAVLTPPPPVLRDLVFEPALDHRVMRSFEELHAVPATRVFLEAASRFWETAGFSGSVTTDGPLGLLSHATSAQPGPRGIIDSFTYGEQARALARLSETERLIASGPGSRSSIPLGSTCRPVALRMHGAPTRGFDAISSPFSRGKYRSFSPQCERRRAESSWLETR